MSYYDRYSWYNQRQPNQGPQYMAPPPNQQQDEQGNQTPNTDALQQYLMQGQMTAPVQSYGAGTPMVSGGSYTPTSGMYSPVAGGDPFTSGMFTPAGGGAGGGGGALGGQGAIGGQGALSSSAGGAGGNSMGSMAASAGPWAALAAAIAWNEENSRKQGRRAESRGERVQDYFTGRSLERDTDHYGDKVGGVGGRAIKLVGQLGNPLKRLF